MLPNEDNPVEGEIVHAMINADAVMAVSGDGSEPLAEDPYDIPNPDEDEPDPGPAPNYMPEFDDDAVQDDGDDVDPDVDDA